VHPADGRRLLEGVDDRLRRVRRVGIPRCHVGGGRQIREQDAAVDDVRNFLDEIVTQLSSPDFRRVRTLRFPRYCLSRWAWQLVASGRPQVDPDHAWSSAGERLRAFIRGRSTAIGDLERIHREVAQDLPWRIRTLLSVLPSVGTWLTARLWTPLRWLGGRHLEGSHSIADLVTRVTGMTERKDADLDAWKNVLVAALLEDLRGAYRRTTVLGAGRRRTTHCVLLLNNADQGSVGREFVDRMDAELRDADRPRECPLLVICTSATSLDCARHGNGPEWSIDNVQTAMTEWKRAAVVEHHPRVLQLAVPKGAAPPGIHDELQDTWLPVGRRPCTRWLAGALVLVAAFSLYEVGYDQTAERDLAEVRLVGLCDAVLPPDNELACGGL